MKRILNALARTLGFIAIGVTAGLTPVILDRLLGPTAAIVVVLGLLTSGMFYLIYRNEK
jgi:hypothetical protein